MPPGHRRRRISQYSVTATAETGFGHCVVFLSVSQTCRSAQTSAMHFTSSLHPVVLVMTHEAATSESQAFALSNWLKKHPRGKCASQSMCLGPSESSPGVEAPSFGPMPSCFPSGEQNALLPVRACVRACRRRWKSAASPPRTTPPSLSAANVAWLRLLL